MKLKTASNPVLITFPPSLDSELGRFLMQHYGVQYHEQRHAFIFSTFATLWHGSTVIFPLLYDEFLKLPGPAAIARYYDDRCALELRLWPEATEQRQQVESDWSLFNQTLAFATAVFAYYHLLPHRALMIDSLSSGTPGFERAAVQHAYPLFAGLLTLLLRLNAQHSAQSLDVIRSTFSTVESRLAAGRSYLVGDRLTLSDLAFAVAAAPVVLPPKYGGPIPSFDQMPTEVQAVVNEMRARPAGAFALQIYKERRDRVGSSA
jgi:glutathione S-transferase